MTHQVLFIIPQLTHGGSNRSLQSIFSAFPDSDWAVYSLDDNAGSSPYSAIFSTRLLSHGWLYNFCNRKVLVRKVLNAFKNYLKMDLWSYVYAVEARRIQRRFYFDIVVGFEESYATLFASYFPNTQKIAWMHCDYDLYKVYSNGRDEHWLYQRFDKIIAVSKFAKETFVRNFPETKDKSFVIYNLLDTLQICESALEPINDSRFTTDMFTIVSVGRISEVKQFQKIPDFIHTMKQRRPIIRLKWYIIGDGDVFLKNEIERKIIDYSLQDELILLGAKDNPYPYIKQSNLLVCTSRTESWSYVINEAKTLHTPVVTIRCGSSEEVVEQGKTGFITTEQELPNLLTDIIDDKDHIFTNIQQSVKQFNYDNDAVVENLRYCFI